MEKTKEENDKIYILGSIKNIDSFISKNEVIDYYSKKYWTQI